MISRIEEWKGRNPGDVAGYLAELGGNQFDLYTGSLSVEEIREAITCMIRALGITTREDYIRWLGKQGYKTVTLSDQSRWILRKSETGKDFVHAHPGRNQPLVIRVKANHIKTAVAFLTVDPGRDYCVGELSTGMINKLRHEILGLSPVRSLQESMRIVDTVALILSTIHICKQREGQEK